MRCRKGCQKAVLPVVSTSLISLTFSCCNLDHCCFTLSISTIYDTRNIQEGLQMSCRSREPGLTHMPRIANLAATNHFHKEKPAVPEGLPTETVPLSSETSASLQSSDDYRVEPTNTSPQLVLVDNQPARRPTHGARPQHEHLGPKQLVISGSNARTNVKTSRVSSKASACQHQQCHTIVYGHLVPGCMQCRFRGSSFVPATSARKVPSYEIAAIEVGARPLLHTMQGFPYDLRCSGVEASRLMNLDLEGEEVSRSDGSFDQRPPTVLRVGAGSS